MADAEYAIELDQVALRYGDGPDVLRDLDLALRPGSFHFVTGPSGAGKSSLLKLMAMTLAPSAGAVRLFGQDLAAVPHKARPAFRRRIGVVFQEPLLLEHLSAFDNVAVPLRIAGRKPADYRQDVAELLAWVGLGARMDALPATLAGGERQRLAIARALVNRPEVLIADEPTGSVDQESAQRILRLFTEMNRLGATVVIATHDNDLVARSGQPELRLDGGRLRVPQETAA